MTTTDRASISRLLAERDRLRQELLDLRVRHARLKGAVESCIGWTGSDSAALAALRRAYQRLEGDG